MSEIRNITVSTVQDVTFSSNMLSDDDIRHEFKRRFGAPMPELGMEAKQLIRGIKQALYLIKEQASEVASNIESAQSQICNNDGYKSSVYDSLRNLADCPVNEVESLADDMISDLDYIETDVDLDDREAQDLYDKADDADRDIIRLEQLLGLEGDYTCDEDEGPCASDAREPALENMTERAL